MRRSSSITLVLITLFVVSLVSPYNLATDTSLVDPSVSESGFLSEGETAYTGVGSALDVSFKGTFVNASAYSDTSSTLSNLLTPGVSYSVENATTVTWTANVLVSPPAEVAELNFTVSYPVTDWKIVSVADPLGVDRTTPTEWYVDYDNIIVRTSAVDTYGVWTLTFTAVNHIDDLEMGPSGGPYTSLTTTFDTGDTMRFGVTSSWITGASAEFDLIDPTGSIWYSSSDSEGGATTHLLSSFRYRKDITIHNVWVTGNFTDFPVLIDILDTDLHDDVQADADDIVFVSNSIILSHEIELFNQAYNPTQAHLVAWVKANLSSSTDTIISMYYGNPVVGPQSDPENVWTSSYSAVWHLGEDATDEGTSTDHLDSTSGDYYGDQVGNEDVTGIFGTGQRFDGVNDEIIVDAARGLEPVGDVTFSGWFKLDTAVTSTPGPTQVILTKAIGADDDMHIVIAGSDYLNSNVPNGSLVFKTENAAAGQRYVWSLRTTWAVDTWYYFTCTMYSATPTLNTVYVNGVDNTNSSYGTVPYANVTFTDDWVIGGGFMDQMNPKDDNGWFEGTIDELRISNTIRSSQWINTEWLMLNASSSFRTLASASTQTSPNMFIDKALDLTAPSGLWTVSAHYNDSGSSVSHRVGEYQRNFIVRRATTLSIESPSDAASGLESLIVGDMLYLVVDLSDANNADPAIGATVSMNWTVSGVGTTEYFEDLGDGRYSIARNTSELSDRMRWRIEIDSTHPYYFDASDSFNLDIFHTTQLTYESVSTTPTGFDFTATLVYRDTWDNSLISGATITFDDGSPVIFVPWTNGRYNITIATGALSKGEHTYIFNATNSANLYDMASVDVTFTLRAHYTAVTVSGNLETPYGDDTTVNIVLVDLDTGLALDATVVDSLSFVSSYGTQSESSVSDLIDMTLDTNTWSVGITSVDLNVVMSDSDYYAPSQYTFDVEIRNHLTAVTIVGDLTTAYGADTTITVSLTDLDGGTINIGSVTSFKFTSSQPDQFNGSLSSFTLDLKTSSWPVSTIIVTIEVVLSGNYDNPVNYVFSVTIRTLDTTLYNAPSNLVFTQGSDFTIDVHFNVSEVGQYFGDPINGLSSGEFVVTPYGGNITALGDGMYRITISWSIFNEQGTDFTIDIDVTPSSNLYASASLVVSFQYREIISDLTANLYTVSTPYNMDVTIHLYFTDRDSGIGITTATISANPDILISGPHVVDGDYLVTLDSSTLAIGSHAINLTASASDYEDKWLIITIVVTQIHTDAEPSTIYLDIPSGNTEVFTIDWTDLDNSIPIQTAIGNIADNWNGTALVIVWTGTQYQITFETTTSDSLGIYLLWFNFTKGAEYQPGYCEIQIEIRSHDTILTSDSPPPTALNALINITMYYYDFDDKVGIHDLGNVQEYVFEDASPIASDLIVVGSGYYIVQIDAATVGRGLHNFTIYINWTGAVQQYENKFVFVSVSVVGVDSQMTLTTASDPSAYLETMTYIFLYSEKDSGIGITNSTNPDYGSGHVHISVSFDAPFDPAKVTISEVGSGYYQIDIDTTGFGQIGQFSMTITIDWDPVDPFYSTRDDTVSVWVLSRDTLLLVNPPSPVSFGEDATFTFRWEDTALSIDIQESGEMDIAMNVTFGYVHNSGIFTVTIDTTQFGDMGTYVMTLNLTWAGEPFYANRTSQISITVLARQTTLDYPTPDPTFYSDNVTIIITWTDVTNGASDGILGAIIVVSDESGVIPNNEYDVRAFAGGVYEIEFSTSRFTATGLWEITIQVSRPETYILTKSTTRKLDVRQRSTILSYEAIGKVAYGEPIEYILYFNDLYTSTIIGNGSGDVTLEILTTGSWVFASTWNAVDERYDVVITSYPESSIGVQIDIHFNMTFANNAPFYAPDDVTATFELRERLSLLSLEIAPNPAPFLDDATFRVQFMDVDADFGISADYIWVYYGMTQLNIGSEYTYTPLGGGNYELSVNSTTLGGIGQWAISVEAYWTSGAPYHNNASAAVNIRVTTRDTIVDITVPPSQTSFLDDVTFTFEYTDLYRGTAITSILTTDITLYNNGTLVNSGDFSLISSGSGFILTVDSEILGSTLGRYNLTIIVDWNELTSPYYVDAQTTTWVTVTTRTLSFALDPLDETRYGDLLNITFTLTDMSIGSTVDGADISFASQTLTLVEGVDYNIIPSGAGVYIIRVDTVALGSPGEFLFDLDISWDSGTSPYYRSMNTIELTGVISDIETVLIPLSDQVTVLWKVSAPISVDYQNMLWMNFTSGATVTWTWPGVAVGTLTETGFDGTYTAGIDTSLSGAGTYLITVEAWKNNFEVARAYITIVVQSLPSVIEPIDPLVGSIAIPRGSGVNITVYFKDTLNTLPIPSIYVVSATATFEGFVYSFYYSGTPGQWIVEIPANEPTIQPQGAYSLLIQASFDNFEPSSYILNIELLASRTEIILTGDTLEDMVVTYSQNAVLTVNLTKPDFGGVSFADGDLRWIIDEKGWTGNFTNNGDGTFSVVIDTIELGFGIWPVRIQANIWATASEFTDSSTSLTLTIKRIQTDVIRPTELDVAWGWTGNLTFIYNGTFGPIEDAYVEFTGEILVGNLYELSNGVYLVEVDTTLANPGIFTVTLTFQKENYQEAPVGVQFLVRAAQTEIYVDSISYTPTYDEVLEDMYNLEIPIGDSVSITFFYNDTDTGNDFVGGLSGAISTDLTNLYNMYYMDIPLNVTVIDLGNGLYRVVFDTTDVEIGAIVSSEPYRMYIEMSLANRTNSEILFRITVIDIPTQLTILDDQDRWIFINGESLTIELLYIDTWHDSGIAGAYFSANSSINAPFEVATEEGPTPGQYFVTISASGIKFTPGIGSITIEIGNGTYTIGGKTLIIEISQNGTDVLAMNSIIYGLPLGIVILIIGFAYVRVWSVPKRLRQINSQIKTIRKGKIPKPVTEAKSRQDLVADLFNDTYSQVAIVRTPEQMPLESIPVDVPELGELLIQLAILTNLDQQELDEFKADIAKMKISEQAAFVKEVIVQEAIRAGRREHKTVEQILEEVEAQASKRIAGEGDAVAVEDGVEPVEVEPDVETVILPDTDEATVPDTEVPSETVADEDPTIPSDRLSPFEIEELKKDLEAKGVPLHEIDTILKQAQELPRNLVEELIRSLEREK